MNSQITGLRVASVVFGLMAIAQLARLLIRPGGRGRLYDAIVAKCAGLHHFGRTQSLALETRWYADQVNESVLRAGAIQRLVIRPACRKYFAPSGHIIDNKRAARLRRLNNYLRHSSFARLRG
jgi:hypothetical protein